MCRCLHCDAVSPLSCNEDTSATAGRYAGSVVGRSAPRYVLAFLLVALTACSTGGQPVASDTYLPPSVTGAASDGPAVAGSPSAGVPLPPVSVVTPVLQAISTVAFTPAQAQAVRAIPGIAAVARVGLGLITADVGGGARQLSVAAVDPLEFRPLSPQPTASAPFVWQGLLQGQLFLAHEEQPVLGVSLGTDLALRGPKGSLAPRIGGLAANGVPNLAGALVTLDQAQALGLPGPGMLLVAVTSGATLDAVSAKVARTLPQAQVQPVAGLVEHALVSGAAAARMLGSFTYKANPDGSVTENAAWVRANIVTTTVPILGQVTCNKVMIPQLEGALTQLQQEGLAGLVDVGEYRLHPGDCYQARFVDSDPTRGLSYHAWGIAIDLNRNVNPEGGASHQDPRLITAFEHWGFRWGGLFSPPDPMHFELAGIMAS